MPSGSRIQAARAWVPSVAAFRHEIELVCTVANSSCPGCGMAPKNKPTGYIKHLQICKSLTTPELTRLAALSWYVCARGRDNASSRVQRPTLQEFKAEGLGPVLRELEDEELDSLWEMCQHWTISTEIPFTSTMLQAGIDAAGPSEAVKALGKVRQRVASMTEADSQDFSLACRTVLPIFDACIPPELQLPYSEWRQLLRGATESSNSSSGEPSSSTTPLEPSNTPLPSTPVNIPPSVQCSPALPLAWEYLSRLPGGLLTLEYQSMKSSGILCQQIQHFFPGLQLADVPEECKLELGRTFDPEEYVPETVLMLQTCLVRDLHFGGDTDKYLDFCYTTAYQSFVLSQSSTRMIDTRDEGLAMAPMWWRKYKRGSTLRVMESNETSATLSLEYPARIYLECMLQGFKQSIRAFMDHQGYPVGVTLMIKSLSEAHFLLTWKE